MSVLWAPLLPAIAMFYLGRDDSFGRVALARTRRPMERPDYVALLPEDDHDFGTYRLGNGTSDFMTCFTRCDQVGGLERLAQKVQIRDIQPVIPAGFAPHVPGNKQHPQPRVSLPNGCGQRAAIPVGQAQYRLPGKKYPDCASQTANASL